jgi:hypothetical protein
MSEERPLNLLFIIKGRNLEKVNKNQSPGFEFKMDHVESGKS